MTRTSPHDSLNLRVGPELKQRIRDYARVTGITLNAAASVLLDRGLRAEQPEQTRGTGNDPVA